MGRNPRIAGGRVFSFDVLLKTPFITSLGRKTRTTNVGLELQLSNGIIGYGEASSSIVMAHLSPARLASALKQELRRAVGREIRDQSRLVRSAWRRNTKISPAAAAFECALTDALSRTYSLSMADWFGGSTRELQTDITLSASDAGTASASARRAVREGFDQLKIKVGTGIEDFPRIESVWRACRELGKKPEIMLDGNQSMTRRSAVTLIERCLKARIPVTLLEQPLPAGAIQEAAKLKRELPIPLAADESVRSPEDAVRLIDADAADIINVKVAKTGMMQSLEIVALARAGKKTLMIGCMQESARGLSASVHLACGVGEFRYVDLDSDHLLEPNQPTGTFRRTGPKVNI